MTWPATSARPCTAAPLLSSPRSLHVCMVNGGAATLFVWSSGHIATSLFGQVTISPRLCLVKWPYRHVSVWPMCPYHHISVGSGDHIATSLFGEVTISPRLCLVNVTMSPRLCLVRAPYRHIFLVRCLYRHVSICSPEHISI